MTRCSRVRSHWLISLGNSRISPDSSLRSSASAAGKLRSVFTIQPRTIRVAPLVLDQSTLQISIAKEVQIPRFASTYANRSDTDEGPDGKTWLPSSAPPNLIQNPHLVHIENRNLNPPARFGADYRGFQQPFANNESAAACTAVPLKKSRFPEVQNSTALVKTMSRKASSLMTPCSTSS